MKDLALRIAFAFVVSGGALTTAATAEAQGVQGAEIRGVVTDSTGAVAAGAVVTVKSPAAQGERSVITDRQGAYIVRGLPPGTYTATFTLPGFATVQRTIELSLAASIDVSVSLAAGGITEEVTVVGQVESTLRDPQVSVGMTKDVVDPLPIGRSPFGIATTMPGLTTVTPNAGQLTISGAFSYDNVFLVDGTDVNDNLFGIADGLYIEDAIDETQVLTGGISAEYGRFSGGVINVVSRRGGDTFSGSIRETWTNPTWSGLTPFERENEVERNDTLNKIHEGTFGGPLVRGRLWFFGAGRLRNTSEDETFPLTGIAYVIHDKNKRGQINLTTTIANAHTISGQYIRNSSSSDAPAFGDTIDPAAIVDADYPNSQFVTNYRGTLHGKLFVEAQYSQKRSGFRNFGGTSTAIVDSPIFSLDPSGAYNAPYFDSSDPEDRDNHQISGSAAYFLAWHGGHDLKAGGEFFRTTNRGGNSQSATGYVFDTDYLASASGKPLLDADGRLIPVFFPGETVIENWLPVKGATINIRTTSLFVRDRWRVNSHLSVDLGTRFEKVGSDATGGIVGLDTDAIVPRLGLSYDPRGDGQFTLQSTYSHYAGKYNEAQFSRNSNVGNPDALFGIYVGPSGQGRSFAPGFDPRNYIIVDGSFPTANVIFDPDLSSPLTREFTLQAGSRIGPRAFAKLVYSNRHVSRLVEDFITLDTGATTVSKGGITDVFSNILYTNSDLPQRKYQALQLLGQYTPTPQWTWNAAWTIQLKNEGNFVGEAANQPGLSSVIGDYPEAFTEERNYPIGRLPQFQRHALRVWSLSRFGLGRAGRLDIGGFFSANSALTYSLRAAGEPLSLIQLQRIDAYASAPSSQTIYFGPRGSESFRPYNSLDLSATYHIPIGRKARPWIKLELYNVAANDKLITWNTTLYSDLTSPRDELGLPTGYIQGPSFGEAQSSGNYLTPRTFQMAFGVRF